MEKFKIKQVIHNQNNIVLFDFKKDEKLIDTKKKTNCRCHILKKIILN